MCPVETFPLPFILFKTYCAFLSLSILLIMEIFQPLYFQIVLLFFLYSSPGTHILFCIFYHFSCYPFLYFSLLHSKKFLRSIFWFTNYPFSWSNLLYNHSIHFQIILYFYFYAFLCRSFSDLLFLFILLFHMVLLCLWPF